MAKVLIQEVRPHVRLYRDPKNGIAWVEDGTSGLGYSAHSNISSTGSVRGMKNLGHWRKTARTVRSHGWIYNIDSCIVTSELDEIAREACRCGGNHDCGAAVENIRRPSGNAPHRAPPADPRKLNVFEQAQLKIARDTLRMPDAIAGVMGGMTKAQAKRLIEDMSIRRHGDAHPLAYAQEPQIRDVLRGGDPFPMLRNFYAATRKKRQQWLHALDALSFAELDKLSAIAADYGTAAGVEMKNAIVDILNMRRSQGRARR